MKVLIKHLYLTNKYEIINYCGGIIADAPELSKTPWLSLGSLPRNEQLLQNLQREPRTWQLVQYGDYLLNDTIQKEKPDVYFACEDPWALNPDKPWWNKIPCVLHTTLDSLPILPMAVDLASKVNHYWTWSNFAEKALHKLGHTHVKTVHGAIDTDPFYRLTDKEKFELKQRFNLPPDAFIIGFVFRNQLRKSVDKLLEGYKIFKAQNPQIKNTYLYLHTHWNEQQGWDIPRFIQEYGINPNEILTTYICRNCKEIEAKPFNGQDQNCRFCGTKGDPQGKGQITCNVGIGATEKQLNQVYNLFSVYCHPFNSGGQEIPIQEAKLTELITLVTNYSCGEEMCEESTYSLPLEWFPSRQPGTQFIKAETNPNSIAKQLLKVYKMHPAKKREWEMKGRAWTLENYSIHHIGKFYEDFLDNLPENIYDYKFDYKLKNENYPFPIIEDDTVWLKNIYKEILDMDEPGKGLDDWLTQIKQGAKREDIYQYFINVAKTENQKNQKTDFNDLLIHNDKKQIAIIQPGSIGDLIGILGILESIRHRYSSNEWNIYMITESRYFEIFEGCEFIDKLLPYQSWMDQNFLNEGIGNNKGYFDIAYQPFWRPQRSANYTHNGEDLVDLKIK